MELLTPLSDTQFPTQLAAYTAAAGNTTAWPAGPQGVVVWSSSDAYIAVGEGAVATSGSLALPANTPVPITVPKGTGAPWRVSALQVSAGGIVYAKPMNKE